MDTINKLIAIYESPLLDLIIKGSLIYLAVLWFAVIIWVARDVINRSNSIFFQVLVILSNIVLPIFGLILYLIIRPSKTLLEKYYEEMEYNFLHDHAVEDEKCPRCEEHISSEFLYCPACTEKIRNSKPATAACAGRTLGDVFGIAAGAVGGTCKGLCGVGASIVGASAMQAVMDGEPPRLWAYSLMTGEQARRLQHLLHG